MQEKISISENGIVSIPTHVQMNIAEITSLFETTQAVIRKCIKQIEKQAVIKSYNTSTLVVKGGRIVCDDYGLEMVIAISFQVQSKKAKQFREYILQRLITPLIELKDWKSIFPN